jgi:tRNA dimethylallyltransferase
LGGDELLVICGPTAAGKSALALELARRHRGIVVSADSRQIYRGFDIGTAKPTLAEQRSVPHRGIDLIEPTQRFSAAAWGRAAERWIAEAATQGRPALIVGGTGFYVRALTEPLFGEPELDAQRRAALASQLAALPTSELRLLCERLDAPRAHLGRTQLLRAIEIATLTGVPLSRWHNEQPARPGRRARYLVVDPGASLRDRIRARVEAMLAEGWVDEVQRLAASVPAEAPAWKATGYGAMRELVRGQTTLDAAAERVTIATRQYAKRQRTWFRHQLAPATTVHLDPELPDAIARAEDWMAA